MRTDFLIQEIIIVFTISGKAVLQLLPYVAAGTLLGELLKFTSWTKLVYRICTRYEHASIVFSVILGAVSPLCTYGTVPFVIQLFRAGVPLAPLISFLCASSLMNPQLFMITWGGISPEMALARLISILLFGILTGYLVRLIPQERIINAGVSSSGISGGEILCRPEKEFTIKKLLMNTWKSLQFVSYYMLLGILIGSAIEVFVPGQLIFYLFKPGQWYSIILASLLGVPLYACGGGTIPMINSMLMSGMSKGAALAFFVAGPATRVTPLSALATFMRPKYIVLYVFLLLCFSVMAGILYQ